MMISLFFLIANGPEKNFPPERARSATIGGYSAAMAAKAKGKKAKA